MWWYFLALLACPLACRIAFAIYGQPRTIVSLFSIGFGLLLSWHSLPLATQQPQLSIGWKIGLAVTWLTVWILGYAAWKLSFGPKLAD
jgi:hypothetical protein